MSVDQSQQQQQPHQQQQQQHTQSKKTPKFLINNNFLDTTTEVDNDTIDSIFNPNAYTSERTLSFSLNMNGNCNHLSNTSTNTTTTSSSSSTHQQQQQQQHQQHRESNTKMNDIQVQPILKNLNHRQSVRSISEFPNVIGATIDHYDNDVCTTILTAISWAMVVLFFPFSLLFTFRIVQEYERAVIFRLGRLKTGSRGPGMIFFLPCIESSTKVDMRTVSFDVAPQEVLTKDSVTVSVDAVVYYRVFNPAVSVANVENAQESTRLLAQTSLRNVLGQKSLSEILSDRESVSRAMRECLEEATDPWGIEVERVEFKDVRLPVQLQRAMATEAEAAREARAKVIAAEGEQRAAKALKGAADIINQSPCALQLRYLQTLNNIAAEKNSTIIFPIPVELLKAFPTHGSTTTNSSTSNSII